MAAVRAVQACTEHQLPSTSESELKAFKGACGLHFVYTNEHSSPLGEAVAYQVLTGSVWFSPYT